VTVSSVSVTPACGSSRSNPRDDDGGARADDIADASTVAASLGAACAPDGFEIVFDSLITNPRLS
jgi:hypothetical protein